MLMTEEQAREKICHKFLTATGDGDFGRCLAADCMAWRWGMPQRQPTYAASMNVRPPVPDAGWEPDGVLEENTRNLPEPNREAGEKQFRRMWIKRIGFCGLAGKPGDWH